jgi:hypothetical protein
VAASSAGASAPAVVGIAAASSPSTAARAGGSGEGLTSPGMVGSRAIDGVATARRPSCAAPAVRSLVAGELRKAPSHAGSRRRMRSASGGCVARQAKRVSGEAVAEVEVARLRRVRRRQLRARSAAADLLERAGDAERVAGELNGRGVGQELALARDGALDQARRRSADPADDVERQPKSAACPPPPFLSPTTTSSSPRSAAIQSR